MFVIYLTAFFFPSFRRQLSLSQSTPLQSPLLWSKRCFSHTPPGTRPHFSVLLGGFFFTSCHIVEIPLSALMWGDHDVDAICDIW